MYKDNDDYKQHRSSGYNYLKCTVEKETAGPYGIKDMRYWEIKENKHKIFCVV